MRRLGVTVLAVLAVFLSAAIAAAAPQEDPFFAKVRRKQIKELTTARDADKRVEAAEALGGDRHADAVAALAQALVDRDVRVRRAAARGLWETGEGAKAAEAALRGALTDPDAAVVARAAGALEMMDVDAKELVEPRRRALAGAAGDRSTAFLAARGLIGLDPPASLLPPVLDYWSEQRAGLEHQRFVEFSERDDSYEHNVELADKAIEELAETGDRALIAPLRRALATAAPPAPVLLKALSLFEPLPDGWVALLVEQMRSTSADVRELAASLAGRQGGERAVTVWAPVAIALLNDGADDVRGAAARSLGDAGGLAHAAAPVLARMLSADPEAWVRRASARALGAIGDATGAIPQGTKAEVAAQARPALVAALNGDADSDVRDEALDALNELWLPAGEIVAEVARTAASTPDTRLASAALQVLRNRQGQAKAAVPVITPLLQHADQYVRRDAKTAIEWIERGGPGTPAAIGAIAAARPAAEAQPGRGAPAAKPIVAAGGASEAEGLAALRRMKLEFSEQGFHRALMEADPEAVAAYLDAGMSPNLRFSSEAERSPLMVAFFWEACKPAGGPTRDAAKELVRLLIARGADVNQSDENANTALMFAADKCDRELLRLLLGAGAKVNARNGSGLTALEMGLWSGNPGLEELIAAGARLKPETAKAYLEAYKDNPQALALVRKASAK